jgi:hypothetical protein
MRDRQQRALLRADGRTLLEGGANTDEPGRIVREPIEIHSSAGLLRDCPTSPRERKARHHHDSEFHDVLR